MTDVQSEAGSDTGRAYADAVVRLLAGLVALSVLLIAFLLVVAFI